MDDYLDSGYRIGLETFRDYDCNNPDNPDKEDFCHGWWLKKGVSDGLHNVPNKVSQVPARYQRDYQQGHDEGSWFKIMNPGLD